MGRDDESIASVQRAPESYLLSPIANAYLGAVQTPKAMRGQIGKRVITRLSGLDTDAPLKDAPLKDAPLKICAATFLQHLCIERAAVN
jgi:hypothetical protein